MKFLSQSSLSEGVGPGPGWGQLVVDEVISADALKYTNRSRAHAHQGGPCHDGSPLAVDEDELLGKKWEATTTWTSR